MSEKFYLYVKKSRILIGNSFFSASVDIKKELPGKPNFGSNHLCSD